MTATLDQLNAALVKADAAGNVDDARALADEIRRLRAAGAPTPEAADQPGKLESLGAGLGRGVGRVALNVQDLAGKALEKLGADSAGKWLQQDAAQGQSKLSNEVAPYKAANPVTTGAGELGGEIAATLPVGGMLGKLAGSVGLSRLGAALTSGGMKAGSEVAPTILGKTADMGIRMAGGAGTGAASAALIDPESATTGGVVGALLPPVAKVAGVAGDAASALVRPFFKGGQEQIAGNALRTYATNPNTLTNLQRSAPVVEGSMPTAVMAAGDEGLAGLSRTMQSVDPRYAAELSSRAASQNAARTAALENVAGNTGKLALAKESRDAATGPMREAVLDAAGQLPARPVLDSIDALLAKPDNAGKLAQAALSEVRNRIAKFAPDGQIDARALYAIRKDINDTLGGKLQGESGNLKLASGQLVDVKGIIDNAIDKASRVVEQSAGREVMPFGANIERAGVAGPYGSQAPRPTWKQYLDTYAEHSRPINQMEKLDEVLKSVSTGTVDQSGNAVLSAAKLNNVLRNQGAELQKLLAPEQLDLLRKIAADMNASQLANNAGKAVGSNTVQNLAQANVLASVLGQRGAETAPAQSALARILQIPYGSSNKMIQERIGAALLDPKEAARLMADPQVNRLMQVLNGAGNRVAQIGYRSAPAISANR